MFDVRLPLSGERFGVVYRLTGTEAEAHAKARDICVEQTIEFPADLVTGGDIRTHILGRIELLQPAPEGGFEATISYAVETTGFELTQFLNVVFGNSSIKPGIRVERLELSPGLLQAFKGPRFGRDGLRGLLGAPTRPLLCTALKPMGLSAEALAEFAYRFALGGMDVIKDDHGLANQSFAPFKERIERCAEAVARANRETGGKCIYMPNITGPADQVTENARFAKQAGAGGLLISPGLTGFDAMRRIADDDAIALPVMGHPAFLGSYVTSPDSGISHYALFGQIMRLAGADVTIFPNYGGRFSFSQEDCRSVAEGAAVAMGHIKPIFPAPGGGMDLSRIPDMLETYGYDVMFLIGGALHKRGPDLVANARYFRSLADQI
ncbi:MAG: RuBisCO large subunit C-terminal-like domain-containing protein [Gammaproteobacteria bacterium]